MRGVLVLFILLLGLLGPQYTVATSVSVVKDNNAGVEALKAENIEEGINLLVSALAEDPENARIHLNLGIAFEIREEAVNALKSYKLALKYSKDKLVEFSAHFNIGRVHAASENFDSALDAYQKALELNPSSFEAKANIEMLINAEKKGGKGQGEDDKNKDDKKDQDKKFKQNPKPTPIPFNSKKLSPRDVKRIFEELLQQEQKIRKDEDRKSTKEKSREKDW